MKIIALLTGRGNNTLKNKNILPVLGKPLLYYPAMAAKNCKYITDFYCSSDDDKILNEANKLGYKPIKRPDYLALPTSQHEDAIKHSIEYIKENDNIYPDIIVVLLANSAIVKTEWITKSIENIINDNTISSSSPVIEEMDNHPYRSKQLINGYLEPWFDFTNKNISTNRQDLPKNYVFAHNFWTLNLHNSLYTNNGQQPWAFMGNKIKPIIVEESFDVHTLDDIKKTEKWLKTNINNYE